MVGLRANEKFNLNVCSGFIYNLRKRYKGPSGVFYACKTPTNNVQLARQDELFISHIFYESYQSRFFRFQPKGMESVRPRCGFFIAQFLICIFYRWGTSKYPHRNKFANKIQLADGFLHLADRIHFNSFLSFNTNIYTSHSFKIN